MKKAFYSTFAICAFVFLGMLTSCEEKDPCDLVNCAYSGICDAGRCICQVGYEGIHCETIARDKFTDNGIFNVNEDGSLSPQAQFNATIEEGPQVNQILLKNFRNLGFIVTATVSHDTLWIAPQDHGGYRIEGMGIITGKNPVGRHYYQDAVINITYKTTDLTSGAIDKYGTTGSGTEPSEWNKN